MVSQILGFFINNFLLFLSQLFLSLDFVVFVSDLWNSLSSNDHWDLKHVTGRGSLFLSVSYQGNSIGWQVLLKELRVRGLVDALFFKVELHSQFLNLLQTLLGGGSSCLSSSYALIRVVLLLFRLNIWIHYFYYKIFVNLVWSLNWSLSSIKA